MRQSRRAWSAVWRRWGLAAWGLLALGLLAAWTLGPVRAPSRPVRIMLAALIAPLLWLPARRRINAALEWVRRPSRRVRWIAAAAIAVACGAYFYSVAAKQHRQFYPASHDEQVYAIQTQMLARGRLWMPAHPLGDFFDSFFLLVEPVYAGIYFPGTALLFVPGAWLALRTWVLPLIMTSFACAMMYLVGTELLDGVAGLLGVMLLLASGQVRQFSIEARSHTAMLLLVLLLIGCWLRWLRRPRLGWAVALGALAGWMAITRPIDALCCVAPLVAFSLPTLKTAGRAWLPSLAGVLAGAAPFLMLQVIFNLGVTGSAFKTPFGLYIERDQPGASLGFHVPPLVPPPPPTTSATTTATTTTTMTTMATPTAPTATTAPTAAIVVKSPIEQKRLYYEFYVLPRLREHRPSKLVTSWLHERLPMVVEGSIPHVLLIALTPLSLLAAARNFRIAAVVLMVPLLITGYALYPFFLNHYVVDWMPPIVIIVLAGAKGLQDALPNRGLLPGVLTILIAAAAIGSTPPALSGRRDWWDPQVMDDVQAKLAHLPHVPAVVLFRYRYPDNPHEEPVYNWTTAWPDDARVIRAHDLGLRNSAIFKYYAARRPRRFFYLYDRGDKSLTELGWGDELARPRPVTTTTPAPASGRATASNAATATTTSTTSTLRRAAQ